MLDCHLVLSSYPIFSFLYQIMTMNTLMHVLGFHLHNKGVHIHQCSNQNSMLVGHWQHNERPSSVRDLDCLSTLSVFEAKKLPNVFWGGWALESSHWSCLLSNWGISKLFGGTPQLPPVAYPILRGVPAHQHADNLNAFVIDACVESNTGSLIVGIN